MFVNRSNPIRVLSLRNKTQGPCGAFRLSPIHAKHGKKSRPWTPSKPAGEPFPRPHQSNSPTPQSLRGSLAGRQEQTIVCSKPRGFGVKIVCQCLSAPYPPCGPVPLQGIDKRHASQFYPLYSCKPLFYKISF